MRDTGDVTQRSCALQQDQLTVGDHQQQQSLPGAGPDQREQEGMWQYRDHEAGIETTAGIPLLGSGISRTVILAEMHLQWPGGVQVHIALRECNTDPGSAELPVDRLMQLGNR
jgi:hypothetical protein